MARVLSNGKRSVFSIEKWLGLNENPNGDVGLLPGEAAVMRNFRVTDDGRLRLRPGSKSLLDFPGAVRGLWYGFVTGVPRILAAAGGRIWLLSPDDGLKTDLGPANDAPTHFFGFSDFVYILNGSQYLCWKGSGFIEQVEGYVPLVAISTPHEGGGTLFEDVNLLSAKKRQRFSPDGLKSSFQLAESNISTIDFVKVYGEITYAFSVNFQTGLVVLHSTPEPGTNTVEIGWTKGPAFKEVVSAMRFSETYNGSTDTRIFLYGDGSNKAIYSGINEQGLPDPSYFPYLNVLDADSANTPITSMIKHFDKLLVFKSDGLWAVSYSTITPSDEHTIAAFYTIPIHREIGNVADGQVKLVNNYPRSLYGRTIYTWKSGNTIRDERAAFNSSSRVEASLSKFKLKNCITFDDEYNQEFYVFDPESDSAVVYNYALDIFYFYSGFSVTAAVSVDGQIYLGTSNGKLLHLSHSYRNDDSRPIDAYWESGSMSFGADWRKKYWNQSWITIKPERGAGLTITWQANNKYTLAEKVIGASLITFINANFAHWAFGTNTKPQSRRVKLKLRKFEFAKLIFKLNSASSTATVLKASIEMSPGGKSR